MWQQGGLLMLLNLLRYGGGVAQAQCVLFAEELVGAANNKTLDWLKECDFPGYARIGLEFPDAPAINVGGEGEALSQVLTWTRGAGGDPQEVVAMGLYVNAAINGPGADYLVWYDDSFPTVILQDEGEAFVRRVRCKDAILNVAP